MANVNKKRILRSLKLHDSGYYQHWSCNDVLRERTVVFGRNGSGKSTLVRNLATAGEPNSAITAETDLEVLVFNKDYIDSHVGGVFTGESLSTALFVTGAMNVELEANIEAEVGRRDHLDAQLAEARKQESQHESLLKAAMKAAQAPVQEVTGEHRIHPKTAEKYLDRATPCSGGDDLTDRDTLRVEPSRILPPIDRIPAELATVDLLKLDEALRRDVEMGAQSMLKGLTDDQRRWVEKGAELHQGRETCLLCETTLMPQRSELLAAMRTQEVLKLREDLDNLQDELQAAEGVIQREIAGLDAKTKSIDVGGIDLGEAANELLAAEEYVAGLLACVEQKLKHPHERINLPNEPSPRTPQVDRLRAVIDDRNLHEKTLQENLAEARKEAQGRCLGRLKVKHLVGIKEARRDLELTNEAVNSLRADLLAVDGQIEALQARRMHKGNAEKLALQLTRDLHAYLGHDEIEVQVKVAEGAVGFALFRSNGLPASGLSEGERTAVSILHFLASLNDSERKKRRSGTCVVLDDPISSLDGQSTRNAFHFILRGLSGGGGTDEVGQYIIFTHSEVFFGMWREKLLKRDGSVPNTSAILGLDSRRHEEGGMRVPALENMLPRSIKYRSEYYRLFDQVVRVAEQNSSFIDVGAANATRRLLESFARWKGPNAGNLSLTFNALVKQVSPGAHLERFDSVLQFLQAGSHLEEIDIGVAHEPVSNCRSEVVDCLVLMRAADPAHFEGMFQAVRANFKKGNKSPEEKEEENLQNDQQFRRFCVMLDNDSSLGPIGKEVGRRIGRTFGG